VADPWHQEKEVYQRCMEQLFPLVLACLERDFGNAE
jgi:hypothetical protein